MKSTTVANLLELRKNPSLSVLPPPAAAAALVSQTIRDHSSWPIETRTQLLYAWEKAPSLQTRVLEQTALFNALYEQDVKLWQNVEVAFKADVGRVPLLHPKLAPYVRYTCIAVYSELTSTDSFDPWKIGQMLCIMNWPTLSKDPLMPDAGLWDPSNPSHCATFLKKEGMMHPDVSWSFY